MSLLTDEDLFYLRSIKRHLYELHKVSSPVVAVLGYGIADAALDDNRDWLDCFIDKHEREAARGTV